MEENTENKESQQSVGKGINPLIIVGIVVLCLVLGYFVYKNRTQSQNIAPSAQNVDESMESTSTEASEPSSLEVKEFTINGSNFSFNPSSITINRGDKVKITFKDDDGTHNLTIDGYNISTKTINSGNSESVQFIADKSGSFEYYCSVDSHRERGMTGTLIVQ